MKILANWGNRTMKFALMFCVAAACLDSGTAMSQEVPAVSAQHLRAEPLGSERGVCRRDGGPACDPGLVCLSAMCVFDDRRCGESASQAGSSAASVDSALTRLTAADAARMLQALVGYSDDGLVCTYDQSVISASDGGRWKMLQYTLNDRDTRLCIDQLKDAGLLSVGGCQREMGKQCFERYVSPRGKAKIDNGVLSFPCGKYNFGEVLSIRTLPSGRAASVKYTYSSNHVGVSGLNQCNINSGEPAGMQTKERMFILDDAGVWMIQE